MNKVIDHLDKAQELFWQAVQTVCLDNRHIIVVNGMAWAAQQRTSGALKVKTAYYMPAVKSIKVDIHGAVEMLIAQCP
ncbi:hypothetical protein [Castellaniella sp.]|uniref:hypothetical protein n=1 Tax=Castellaniella sp. TaxID=1955812 RepID=UPI003C76C431